MGWRRHIASGLGGLLLLALLAAHARETAAQGRFEWLKGPPRAATVDKRPGIIVGEATVEEAREPGARPEKSSRMAKGLATRRLVDLLTSIQVDRRQRVAEVEFGLLPFSAVTLIQVRYRGADSPYQGTGFLVEPGLVITAAHVLHNPEFGPAEELVITPGCFADKVSFPPDLKFVQVADGTRVRIHERWGRPDHAAAHDYGAILLSDTTRYANCGRFRLHVATEQYLAANNLLNNNRLMVSGFPIDKDVGRRQWVGRGPLMALETGFIRHLIDTEKGQSGSPLLGIVIDPATRLQVAAAIGVHSRGARDGTNNVAARIDAQFLQRVERWKKEMLRLNAR